MTENKPDIKMGLLTKSKLLEVSCNYWCNGKDRKLKSRPTKRESLKNL
jgi:hypothetical protein